MKQKSSPLGDGAVYCMKTRPRSQKRWIAWVLCGYLPSGKPIKKVRLTRTKKEAIDSLPELRKYRDDLFAASERRFDEKRELIVGLMVKDPVCVSRIHELFNEYEFASEVIDVAELAVLTYRLKKEILGRYGWMPRIRE